MSYELIFKHGRFYKWFANKQYRLFFKIKNKFIYALARPLLDLRMFMAINLYVYKFKLRKYLTLKDQYFLENYRMLAIKANPHYR